MQMSHKNKWVLTRKCIDRIRYIDNREKNVLVTFYFWNNVLLCCMRNCVSLTDVYSLIAVWYSDLVLREGLVFIGWCQITWVSLIPEARTIYCVRVGVSVDTIDLCIGSMSWSTGVWLEICQIWKHLQANFNIGQCSLICHASQDSRLRFY